MAKRIYFETVKRWAILIGLPAGTMAGLLFAYLTFLGAIEITGYSGDQICAGTESDPCYAYINLTAKEDIFIYPIGYDPWGRNTPFEFSPSVKDWKLQRSWGSGWRDIPLDKTCTGTWCGAPNNLGVAYSYVLRENRDYNFRIVAYKNNPYEEIKWAVNYEDREYLDPTWYGIEKISFEIISSTPKWIIYDSTGEYDVYISNASDKKTHLGWYDKDGLNISNLDRSLYDCSGNKILDDKDKEIGLKYETNKIPNPKEPDGMSDGYFIALTDAKSININDCVMLNPTVVYQNQSLVQFTVRDLEINNTLTKWNGEEFVSSPEAIWINQPTNNTFKFGANDTLATQDTIYQYEWVSNKEIKYDEYYYFDEYKVEQNQHSNIYERSILDVSDVCIDETYCIFNLLENSTKLTLTFIGYYNSSFGGIFIDPSYSYANVSTEVTLTENIRSEPTYSHLSLNDSDLVLYMPFDTDGTTQYDYTENDNDGTVTGATWNRSGGVYGGAFEFDEDNNEVITISDIGLNSSEPFTISTWAYFVGNADNYDSIVCGSLAHFCLGTNYGGGNYAFRTNTDITIGSSVEYNKWVHLAVTYNGSEIIIYIDGDVDAQETKTATDFTGDLLIGRTQSNPDYFNGTIDEVAIWNRALTETEIAQLYNSTYQKFYTQGNQTFQPQNVTLGSDNRVNITAKAESLNDSNLNGRIYDADISDGTGYVNTESGLVGYWHFDNDSSFGESNSLVYDFSGNGNNGTIVNDAVPTSSGKYEGAFEFDSIQDGVNVGSDSSLDNLGNSSDFTISTWIYPVGNPNHNSGRIFDTSSGSNARVRFYLSTVTAGSSQFKITGKINFDTTDAVADSSTGTYSLNNWQHVVMTYNHTTNVITLYRNAIEPSYASQVAGVGTQLDDSSYNKYIGMSGTSGYYDFNGTIDEVMIFNRSLTEDEIKSLYLTGSVDHANDGVGLNWTESSTGKQELTEINYSFNYQDIDVVDNLVGLWHLNNNSDLGENDTHVYDSSGNGNNGSVTDAEVTTDGYIDGAYNFDKDNSNINMGDVGEVEGIGEITISTWVKSITADSTYNYIISKNGAGTDSFIMYWTVAENIQFDVWNSSGTVKSGIYVDGITDTNWHHIVGVYNGTHVYVVVDGIIGGTIGTHQGNIYGSTHDLVVANGGILVQAWNGSIDEVAIFNKSLTQDEIMALYWNGAERLNAQGFVVDSSSTHLLTELEYNSSGFYSSVVEEVLLNTYEADGADTTKPIYSNIAVNSTVAGKSTNFSILWNDNLALQPNGQYIFSTNNTGEWTNESLVNFTATPNSANVIKVLNSTTGLSIGYRWYADDNAGNSNDTGIQVLTTTAPTVATISIERIYPTTNLNVTQNEFFNVSFNVTCLTGTCGTINVSLDPLSLGNNFGFVAVAPTDDPNGSGEFYMDGYSRIINDTLPSNAIKITEVGWYTATATEESNFEVGIYNHSGTTGDSLLFSDTTNAKGTGSGWIKATIDWDVSEYQNDILWIAVQLDNTITETRIDRDDSGSGYYDYQTSQSTLSNPWSGVGVSNYALAIYAVYETSSSKSGLINTTIGATPFYTNNSNPQTTGSLSVGQSQTINFWVNATGTVDVTHDFYTFANTTSNLSISNETTHWNVTIIESVADTCDCPGSGNNWEVDMEDYCNLTSACAVANVSWIGSSGYFNCSAQFNITNRNAPPSGTIFYFSNGCEISR